MIHKRESLIIFYCIIIILVCYCFNLLLNKKYNEYKKYYEKFDNRSGGKSNGSKRYKAMKIYKSNEIFDPDETSNADDICDPDGTKGCDPDA
jgi:hypothetical protein